MLLEKFCEDKKLSPTTCNFYHSALNLYMQVTNMSLENLIDEADDEEEKGIRWKHRKVKQHLIDFRNYVFANKAEQTAKRYITAVKTFYNHYEIELHKLPSFNSNQIDKTYKMDYVDLLTRDEIIDAYYEANNVTKCLILFAMSSGLSKVDMLKLSVADWIEACENYITSDDLFDQLMELKSQNDIIPCFKDERQKTTSKYTTFCSPEASSHIVQYLIGRDAKIRERYNEADDAEKEILPERLQESDKLFDITSGHVTYTFNAINNKLGLGKVGKFSKFRCHMLRKFHASTLLNSEILTWTVEEIDSMQGRSMDITHQAYFKNSDEKLFNKYYECVDELMLFQSIHEIDKEAYDKLEKENDFYKQEIIKSETRMEEQQKRIDEIIKNQRELESLLGL